MRNSLTKHSRCILCGSKQITSYLSLGMMAPANNFVHFKNLHKPENKYPLGLSYCHACHISQLTHTVEPTVLFKHYAYFSSTSPLLVTHFIEYANMIHRRFPHLLRRLVVDIGSNDGVLLKPLQNLGAHTLGVDPAKECAHLANEQNISTIQKYFTPAVAKQIQTQYGQASIITANNVMAHTPYIHKLLRSIHMLLAKDGVFIFEVKYMGDILEHNEFDVIYHEHVFSYLLHPLITLLKLHEFKIIDVEHIQIHGGSLRIFAVCSSSQEPIQESVRQMLKKENDRGYTRLSTYKAFAKKPPQIKKVLQKMLHAIAKKGGKIVGYGASAKGTTMLQYCHLNTKTIEYIVDGATSKIGKFTPATHIPILNPNELKHNTPDYILLLAWDHKESIIKKEQWFTKRHGTYILPIPHPTLVRRVPEKE